MPLHRDIHWIGRQWAVTGHGMQLIDQKLQGFFDIEVDRLWEDALIESVHAKEWLNKADFDKGLALARARYPQAPAAVAPPRQITPAPAATLPPGAKPIEPKPEPVGLETPKPVAPVLKKPDPVEPPRAAAVPPAVVVPARQAAPPPPVVKPGEPKPELARLETAKPVPAPTKPAFVEPVRAAPELKAPAIATRTPVATPMAATPAKPPAQAAPAPVIEPATPPPPAVKPTEQKPKVFKFDPPEPVTVTVFRRRPAEPPPAAPPAVVAVAASSRPPVVAREQPKPAPTLEKPAAVEPPRETTRIDASAIAARTPAEPAISPPSLFQMRYECHAKFVRPWRVVAKRPT